MSTVTYAVVFMDPAGRVLGMSDVDGLRWAAVYNRPGYFSVRGLEAAWYDAAPVGGRVQILRNGVSVFSARVGWREEDVTTASVGGVGDLGVLSWRLALPEVTGNFAAQAYDVRTGPAESVILGVVRDNASEDAPITARRLEFSVGTDYGRGAEVTLRCRFHDLLDKAQTAAFAGGVGMRLHDGVFEVYVPRSEPVLTLALERENMTDYRLREEAGDGNYGYGGGQGEGTDRLIREWLDPAGVVNYGRREFWVDRRDTDDPDEVLDEIRARLAEQAGGVTLRVDTQGVTPWEDVWPGDMVRVLLPRRREVVTRVQEMRVLWSGGHEQVTLVVGERLIPDEPSALTVQIARAIGRRVQQLEVI